MLRPSKPNALPHFQLQAFGQDINPRGYSKWPLERFVQAAYEGDLELLSKMQRGIEFLSGCLFPCFLHFLGQACVGKRDPEPTRLLREGLDWVPACGFNLPRLDREDPIEGYHHDFNAHHKPDGCPKGAFERSHEITERCWRRHMPGAFKTATPWE